MQSISYTAARSHLASTMEQVCEDHAPIVIIRSNKEPVVMVSLADFESIMETNYLLSSPANAKRIMQGIEECETLIKKKDKD